MRSLVPFLWRDGCLHLRRMRGKCTQHTWAQHRLNYIELPCLVLSWHKTIRAFTRKLIHCLDLGQFSQVFSNTFSQTWKPHPHDPLRWRPIRRATRAQSFTGTALTSRSPPTPRVSVSQHWDPGTVWVSFEDQTGTLVKFVKHVWWLYNLYNATGNIRQWAHVLQLSTKFVGRSSVPLPH